MEALDAVTSWPVTTAAAGVLRAADVPGPTGAPGPPGASRPTSSGVVVVDRRGPDTVLAWASVSKLLVALAVLVAVEEGTLDLDEPAGPPGSTVRHLLAHASGLDAETPRSRVAPGTRRIYSNAGFEVLADHLAGRSGLPFDAYLADGVLRPLGLDATTLPADASPASGMTGPLSDLLTLGSELLHPSLVHASTMAAATTPAFPGLAGVLPGFGWLDPCDWGLGFELKDAKPRHWTGRRNSPGTFGHFGRSGGFLWVDPAAGVALASLTDRPFGPWARDAWPALADDVLTEVGGFA